MEIEKNATMDVKPLLDLIIGADKLVLGARFVTGEDEVSPTRILMAIPESV